MSETTYPCPNCDAPMQADGPITAAEVLRAIEVAMAPGRSLDAFWFRPASYLLKIRGLVVRPTNAVRDDEVMPSSEYDRQGDSYEIKSIFGIGGQFFCKYGYADSYAEESWSGAFRETRRTTKAVEVWE